MRKALTRTNLENANRLLQWVENEPNQKLDQTIAIFNWQGSLHVGRLMHLYPEKPYIVYISKAPQMLSDETALALKRLRKLPTYKVHARVEFAGPKYLLGLSGDTLCLLSGEDVLYCMVHPREQAGEEYNTGQEFVGFENSV